MTPAVDVVRATVLEVSRTCLAEDAIELDDDLVRLGANSLLAAEIVGELEAEFGVDVVGEFFEGPTPRQIADAVLARLAARR